MTVAVTVTVTVTAARVGGKTDPEHDRWEVAIGLGISCTEYVLWALGALGAATEW